MDIQGEAVIPGVPVRAKEARAHHTATMTLLIVSRESSVKTRLGTMAEGAQMRFLQGTHHTRTPYRLVRSISRP